MAPVAGHSIALGLLAGLIVVASIIDVRRLIIPDWLNLSLFISGASIALVFGTLDIRSAAAGCIIGGLMMYMIQLLFRMLRGYDGLGSGDVKFVAAAGTWTGAEGLAPALLIAASAGLVYALVLRWTNADDRLGRIAFAPALGLGTLSVVAVQTLSGESVMDLLLQTIGTA